MSQVCANCFQDKIAQRFIRKNGAIGKCDFCDSKKQKVVDAHELRDLFDEILGLYKPYEPAPGSDSWSGETLAECLQEWEIFREELDQGTQNEILDEIMGVDPRDADISASEDWQVKSDHWARTPTHKRWPWFAEYVKTYRRFIVEEDPSGDLVRPENWVPDLLKRVGAVVEIKKGARLFRGRLGFVFASSPRGCRLPFPINQMGAPSPKFAKAGRANPEGISYLYCALDPETAIIETGRFPGATVSLRELRAKKLLRLADLRGGNSVLEPLGTKNLAEEVENRTLLESLGNALGQPIHPEDSVVEYVPTQYLAEAIRSAGYDGISFRSALCKEGTNVVIFDPANVRVTRRGWAFDLGRAEYLIHPNPNFVIGRRRRTARSIAIP